MNQNMKVEIEETTINTKKIKVEVPFAFKRDLEPYIKQLMGKDKGGF